MTNKSNTNEDTKELFSEKELKEFKEEVKLIKSRITFLRGVFYGFSGFVLLLISLGLVTKGELIRDIHNKLFPPFSLDGKVTIAHSTSLKIYHSEDPNSSNK